MVVYLQYLHYYYRYQKHFTIKRKDLLSCTLLGQKVEITGNFLLLQAKEEVNRGPIR